jgi:hypothetical protein
MLRVPLIATENIYNKNFLIWTSSGHNKTAWLQRITDYRNILTDSV